MIGAERQKQFLRKPRPAGKPTPLEIVEARASAAAAAELVRAFDDDDFLRSRIVGQPAASGRGLCHDGQWRHRVTPTLLAGRPATGPRVLSARLGTRRCHAAQGGQEGTASFGEVPGYAVGGKTGTADKPRRGGGYYEDKVIATFASVFPAHDPNTFLSSRWTNRWKPPGPSRAAPPAGRPCPWPPRSSAASRRFLGLRPEIEPGGPGCYNAHVGTEAGINGGGSPWGRRAKSLAELGLTAPRRGRKARHHRPVRGQPQGEGRHLFAALPGTGCMGANSSLRPAHGGGGGPDRCRGRAHRRGTAGRKRCRAGRRRGPAPGTRLCRGALVRGAARE